MEDGVILTFNERKAYEEGEKAAFDLLEKSGSLERDPGYLEPEPWKYV